MANGLDSLSTQYKHHLRSLNPLLPQVIEHLVSVSVLTRTEATQVFSTSDQFSRLCQQLALKGTESKATIVSVIEAFHRAKQLGQREPQPKHVCLRETLGHQRSRGKRSDESESQSTTEKAQAIETYDGKHDTKNKVTCIKMDPFLIQFCNFVLQLLWSGSEKGKSHQATSTSPIWLKLDLNREQALAYFPSHLRRSFKVSSSQSDQQSVESLSLSSLLSVFKNYVKKRDALLHENRLLAGKAKLVESLTVRNAHLEEEIWKCRKCADVCPPSGAEYSVAIAPAVIEGETEIIHQLKKKLAKSESRNKELAEINEQWALESQERASELKITQIQLEDAQAEVTSLRNKVKEQAGKNGTLIGTKEEAEWKDLDVKVQLQQERDQAVEENIHLKGELEEARRQIEEAKDEIDELRDRADNLKVQAQSKLPTLTELTALTSENRHLRETLEKFKSEKEALIQKIKELESQPLVDANGTHLNGESTSTYNLTPLSSQITVGQPQLTKTCHTDKKQQQRPHTQSQTTRSPPPPNQPVAEVIGGLHLPPNEQQCPTCHTVFTMLGKREFQSHVAGCHKTS